MRKSINTMIFILIFMFASIAYFIEPFVYTAEDLTMTIMDRIKSSGNIKIEAEKIELDILGIQIEKYNGIWKLKALNPKNIVKFNNDVHKISKIEIENIIPMTDIGKKLKSKENKKNIELLDQIIELSVEWNGKDRMFSIDLMDPDSYWKTLYL